MSGRLRMRAQYYSSISLSSGQLLLVRNSFRHGVLMSERHFRLETESSERITMHTLHSRQILRHSGIVGAYGRLQRRIFLWRRQLGIDTTQQCIEISIPCELCRRDMSIDIEYDDERCLSRGSLLSIRQSVTDSMSSRHELDISRFEVGRSMSAMCIRVLLSE